MYQRNNNFSQALRYLEAALKSALKLKDKYLESDIYVQKALVCVQVGDIPTSKHSLKKAHKLGAPTSEESERIVKYFKAVCKIDEALTSLDDIQPDNNCSVVKLYEQLGDGASDIGNFTHALEYYHKMLENGIDQQLPTKDLVPIYVSLAQTYADNKQYEKAIEYYHKEKECQGDNYGQICRTWLNIAECQEFDGRNYDDVSKSYLKAFECARKASHAKLQVHVLKSLIEVQEYYKQKTHQKQTEEKLQNLKHKLNVSSDDELSEEERDSQKSDDLDNLSISELSESDESEEEGSRQTTVSRRTTKARATIFFYPRFLPMATIVTKRPATVSFGENIEFARRGSRAYSVQHDKRDADLILRRQSIKYQFPNPALEADVKDTDFDSEVDEDEIRRRVYGKPISEMSFVGVDTSVRRPTVSSARRSVVWAHDRKLYEEKNRQQVVEFKSQPYMKHEYPSLRKHYPGTWKLSTKDQIQATTDRLAHAPAPTAASLHLHKYHSLLYKLLDEKNRVPYSTNLQRRPKTSVY